MIRSFGLAKFLSALSVLAACALPAAANAQLTYNVWIDTSSLVGSPDGPFSIDFQLNDGSGLSDGNNWATLSNFQFGGGGALDSATLLGGATGDLGSGVTLTDSSPFNEFYQTFTAGASLSFDLTLTTNADSGDTPDVFTFSLLDGSLFNLPTKSPGTDTFFQVVLDGTNPVIATYASANDAITAPTVSPVPEPATYGLWAGVVLVLAAAARRLRFI
jgi:hypothetical protein